ncbi:MAG: hypothetical protein ABJE47_11645 [bacterium]
MQNRVTHRAQRAAVMGAMALVLTACGAQDVLLEQQQPQIILPNDAANTAGALGLYAGALGQMRFALNGGNNNQEQMWAFEGLFTDEFKSGDTFSQRNDADQRITQTGDGVMAPTYNGVQQARGRARDAINSLKLYSPTSTEQIGEMYMMMGFMEMTLGQNFCNGIPLGETVNGAPIYTKPLTNIEVFTQAIARYDSALTFLTGTDAKSVNVKNATLVAKARALVNLGQFSAAAALVGGVPSADVYLMTFSIPTQSNEWWQMATNTKRYTVGDSFDVTGVIQGALPFASANDPRVKVGKGAKSFDNITPFFEAQNWGREDPVPLISGLDARLIEAEAKLQANDIAGTMTILNALRAAPPKQGNVAPTAMAALATPATQAAAVDLYFREKAFWQFGRGERLSDERRLVRQYGRTMTQVYPSGPFHKGGNYGTLTAFPVPDAEKSNQLFTGCIDGKA